MHRHFQATNLFISKFHFVCCVCQFLMQLCKSLQKQNKKKISEGMASFKEFERLSTEICNEAYENVNNLKSTSSKPYYEHKFMNSLSNKHHYHRKQILKSNCSISKFDYFNMTLPFSIPNPLFWPYFLCQKASNLGTTHS